MPLFLFGIIFGIFADQGVHHTLAYTECKQTHTIEYCQKNTPILK